MKKKQVFLAFFLIISILLCLKPSAFANTIEEIEYRESNTVINTENPIIPFSTTSKKRENYFVSKINGLIEKLGVIFEPSYKTTGLKVKHQGDTSECWAFAYTSALEALNLKKTNRTDIYSPRHLDYSCSNSITNGPSIEKLFNRETNENGGNYFLATAYMASGKGPVLESEMPFINDVTSKINYNDLKNKKARKQLDESIIIDSIYKKHDGNTITYYADKEYKNKLSTLEVTNIRNIIKEQIKNCGSVPTSIYEAGNSSNVCETDPKKSTNHAILVVGWDDNYKAEDWKNKGAYIALNSYGEDSFDKGYIYISYDDIWVESSMIAIKKTSDIDYETVYEHDPLGAVSTVYSSALSNDDICQNIEEISAINVFNRNTSKNEILKEVGISLFSYEKAEVYVTQEFDTQSGLPIRFKKVANMTETLSPGFATIQFNSPVILTKEKFAVCVRYVQDNEEKIATVAIENKAEGISWWDNVTGNKGETYFIDVFNPEGANRYWTLNSGSGQNMFYLNASIKAYTSQTDIQPTIRSTDYSVNNVKMIISMVPTSTDINTFKSKITSNMDYKITDKNGKEITSGIIKTSYKVKIDNTEYEIAVKGDLSGDGLMNTLDLARMRFHIGEKPGYILQGIFLEAADITGNGVVNIIDLARLRRDM